MDDDEGLRRPGRRGHQAVALPGPNACIPIPQGEIEHSQLLTGRLLLQNLAVRHHDGFTWNAFSRETALPADPQITGRDSGQTAEVLLLMAQAVAATETARQARGVLLRQLQQLPEVAFGMLPRGQ